MQTTELIQASPKKLRSGEWGALVPSGDVQRGDHIRIVTRAGKSWEARVAKVVWQGDGKAIVATESKRRGGGSSRGGRQKQRVTEPVTVNGMGVPRGDGICAMCGRRVDAGQFHPCDED